MFVAQHLNFYNRDWMIYLSRKCWVFAEDKLGVICMTVDSFNIKSRQKNVTILHNIGIGNKLLNRNIQW